MTHSFGALLLPSVIPLLFATNPAFTADYADCKAQAIAMGGDARQKFMSSGQAGKGGDEDSELRQGKPCANSCISKDKLCRKGVVSARNQGAAVAR